MTRAFGYVYVTNRRGTSCPTKRGADRVACFSACDCGYAQMCFALFGGWAGFATHARKHARGR